MKDSLMLITLLLSLTAAAQRTAAAAQAELRPVRISSIEFYGYAGLKLNRVRAALPIHEGESFPSPQALDAMASDRGEITIDLMCARGPNILRSAWLLPLWSICARGPSRHPG